MRHVPLAPALAFVLALHAAAQSEVLFSEDFESGGSGWTASGEPQVLWHVSEDGECGAVTRMAVYGLPAACNYKTGGKSSGSFLSPVFTLHGEYSIVVQYDYRQETDEGSPCVELVDEADGKAVTVIGCSCCADPYGSVEIARAAGAIPNPGAWSGKRARLRFGFEADRDGNTGFGCMVDNVRVVASGPPEVLYSADFEDGGSGWTMTSDDPAYIGPPMWHIASDGECEAVTKMGAYNRAPTACDFFTKCSNSGRLRSPVFRLTGAPPFRIEFRSRLALDARGDNVNVHIVDPVNGIANSSGPFPSSATIVPLSFVFDTQGFWSLWSDREGRIEFELAADPTGNKGTGWMVDDVRVWNSGSLPPLQVLAPPGSGTSEGLEPPEKREAKDKEKGERTEREKEDLHGPGPGGRFLADWSNHEAGFPLAQPFGLLGCRDATLAIPKDTAVLGVRLRIQAAGEAASSVALRILTLSPGE